MLTELLTALHKALGQQAPSLPADGTVPGEYVIRTAHLTTVIRPRPVAEIAAPLQVDHSIKRRQDRALKATSPRRALTLQRLRDSDISGLPRFAVVEMAGPKAFQSAEHDPKEAVKSAAASLGVLTQNVTPPTDRHPPRHRDQSDTHPARQQGSPRPPDPPDRPAPPSGRPGNRGITAHRRHDRRPLGRTPHQSTKGDAPPGHRPHARRALRPHPPTPHKLMGPLRPRTAHTGRLRHRTQTD